MIRTLSGLCALLALLLAAPARAQAPTPLADFVGTVAYLWSVGDAEGVADLAPDDGQILLDTGDGSESVNGRHAAAALRALFAQLQSDDARPVRANLSGGHPVRGFGELQWSFRARGTSTAQSSTVYVGALWTPRGWRISELRLIR